MPSEVVLITGYPNLQARRLLVRVLFHEPSARVALVVFQPLLAAAEAALAELSEAQRQRVELLAGDAAAIDMGLSGPEFRHLANEVTRIHSIAHIGYLGADEALARRVNVRAAAEVVELGRACHRLRCIVHHSTAYVSGDRTSLVYEHDLDVGQGFLNAVQRTRLEAEQLLRQHMCDVPIAVVRPTMLVGDSLTGATERFDGPYLLVMLVLGIPRDMPVPLPTGADGPVNIVPLDYVVKSAHHIGLARKSAGRSYHLASPEQLTLHQVFHMIATASGRRTTQSFVPTQVASALLRAPGLERLLQHPRTFLRQIATGARYDTRNATAVLTGSGITCPPLASYVDTWIQAVEKHLDQRRERLHDGLRDESASSR